MDFFFSSIVSGIFCNALLNYQVFNSKNHQINILMENSPSISVSVDENHESDEELETCLISQKKNSTPRKKYKEKKFTSLKFIMTDKNSFDLLMKDPKFLKLVFKTIRGETKQAKVDSEIDEDGYISCECKWQDGRTYLLSEVLRLKRLYKDMEISGPYRLLDILDEIEEQKSLKQDLGMLPVKKQKLLCELNDQKEKLSSIKEKIQKSLTQVIELEEKRILLMQQNNEKTISLDEYKQRIDKLTEREMKIKLKEEEVIQREITVRNQEKRINNTTIFVFKEIENMLRGNR